jgi:catechol 2,3-dioxygenase-like lactoylglutathione lyase family enzyme
MDTPTACSIAGPQTHASPTSEPTTACSIARPMATGPTTATCSITGPTTGACSITGPATAGPMITGINHVAIVTSDLDRFIAFYTEVFDLEVVLDEEVPEFRGMPGFRHALLRLGVDAALHPFEARDNAYGRALPDLLQRGHVDHLSLAVANGAALDEVRRRLVACGASDGAITSFGPIHSVWFVDPDGMGAEVALVLDPTLRGLHGPQPLVEQPA